MKTIALIVSALFFAGCASTYQPCKYQSMEVSQREANELRDMGADVQCPGDLP